MDNVQLILESIKRDSDREYRYKIGFFLLLLYIRLDGILKFPPLVKYA